MQYRLFGRSGLRVSELSLGTMTLGEDWGWGASREESLRIIGAYAEAGGNFIDTANRYTNGTSERYVGEAIAAQRAQWVVATKYTLLGREGDPNAAGSHRKNMVQSLEASLRRLNTGYVDVYWVHAWDRWTPADEVLRALDDMVRAGKVLYIGVSDTPAWVVSHANTLAELRGWTAYAGIQIEYSLIERTPERELLPMARALDLAVAAWAPLGGGVLTGKYRTSQDGAITWIDSERAEEGDRRLTPRNMAIASEVDAIARECERPSSQVAINWLRGRTSECIIPIVGARTVAQIEQSLGCLEWSLSDEHRARLDRVSTIELGFPHDFLALEQIQNIVYSDVRDRVIDHRRR